MPNVFLSYIASREHDNDEGGQVAEGGIERI